MTAFYMWRLMRLTFYGEERFDHHHVHPHESPWTMTVPLMVLAAGSVLVGWGHHAFEHFLAPVFPVHEVHALDAATGYVLLAVAISAGLLGIGLATRFEVKGAIQKVLLNKWYVDEIYDFLFINGLCKGGGRILSEFDRRIVDGGVNGAAWLTKSESKLLMWWDKWIIDGAVRLTSALVRFSSYPARFAQTGHVQTYALFVVMGVLVMFGIYVTRS
jgi:NADH-quinone oxidoreductase subunit L